MLFIVSARKPNMNLSNHCLIAMPDMRDPFFSGSVVYVCDYSDEGATGVVINKPSPLPVRKVLESMQHRVPPYFAEGYVLVGGPVQTDRGFLLHTPAGSWKSSLAVNNEIALTSSDDILAHLEDEAQVHKALLFMGYSGWSPGQLEQELADNSWLTVPADLGIVFDLPHEARYDAAIKLLNIVPEQLGAGGHA